ncbi:MAG: S41 family peptidase [Phycisphaerales bacterium]
MTNRARLAILGILGACVTAPALADITPERRAEHLASFDQVWETIRDRQWDPYFNFREWDRLRLELRPNVEAATSDREARAPMQELLASLEKSHFGIIPAEAYDVISGDDDATEDEDAGPGELGIHPRYRDGKLVVVRVREGSTADLAGVEPGWVITRVGSLDAEDLFEAARESAGVQRAETIIAMGATARLDGDEGTTVEVEFVDTRGKERTLKIERGPEPGEEIRFGNLPGTRVYQETKTLDNGVGYYALDIFLNPPLVMPTFERFVREHIDAPGIVIDMRGNHGGIITMSMGMGGWFVEEPNIYLGELITPESRLKLVMNPRDVTYTGPVAVLIDEVSISNAELLSAGLKDIGRARVFGNRTAGLLLPSVVELLPNGDGFQYAFAGYESASGNSPEGVGVVPDVEVLETPESLAGGHDPVLEAALEWIARETN